MEKSSNMKTIIITGASGLVARFLIRELAKNEDYRIIAVSRNREKVTELYKEKSVISIDYDNIVNYLPKSFLVHCAFTRSNDGQSVADSLDLAQKIFAKALKYNVSAVINISSRSVYAEPSEGCLNTEDSSLDYSSYYSVGKIVEERMTANYFKDTNIRFTNLRLGSINELKLDNTMVRPLNVFVNNVIKGEPIRVVGGMQVMSYIDPRDIATAICSLLKISQWKSVYNVGTGWLCTKSLLEMAQLVVEKGKQLGYDEVPIVIEEKIIVKRAGLDISRITNDTGWSPRITLEEMINSLFDMMKKIIE